MFRAQQNIANCGKKEIRKNIPERSDTNRGNFLELLHFKSRHMPWLKQMLNQQYKKGKQWTSPEIQKEFLATRMKKTSPMAIYVHCYGHLLNLAIQNTMKNIGSLHHTLATIQSLQFLGRKSKTALFIS